jgi:hypothetical protein
MADLWDGARRLPYFFTVDDDPRENRAWIFCPQCALQHINNGDRLAAHYTTLRSVMCCRCGIVMGPINKAETEEV